jgi:hypothetical protein
MFYFKYKAMMTAAGVLIHRGGYIIFKLEGRDVEGLIQILYMPKYSGGTGGTEIFILCTTFPNVELPPVFHSVKIENAKMATRVPLTDAEDPKLNFTSKDYSSFLRDTHVDVPLPVDPHEVLVLVDLKESTKTSTRASTRTRKQRVLQEHDLDRDKPVKKKTKVTQKSTFDSDTESDGEVDDVPDDVAGPTTADGPEVMDDPIIAVKTRSRSGKGSTGSKGSKGSQVGPRGKTVAKLAILVVVARPARTGLMVMPDLPDHLDHPEHPPQAPDLALISRLCSRMYTSMPRHRPHPSLVSSWLRLKRRLQKPSSPRPRSSSPRQNSHSGPSPRLKPPRPI